MIKEVIESITAAARKLFADWRTLLISLGLYAALLAVIYLFFVVVKEATKVEVLLTVFILPAAAATLFFSLQAMGLSYSFGGADAVNLLKRALKDCWKLLLVSLPIFFLAWLIIRFVQVPAPMPVNSGALNTRSGLRMVVSVVWCLLLYFVLPLLSIQLWIAAMREGAGGAFKKIKRGFLAAFSPRPVLIYLLVVIFFGLIAYVLLSMGMHAGNDWGELLLFGIRVVLALLAIFFGWLIALGAIAEMSARPAAKEHIP